MLFLLKLLFHCLHYRNNISMVRAPPVKVEGFSELMGGGDSTAKHDSEENRMTSPSGK